MDCSTPRLLCPPLSPGVCSNSCPLSQRWYLTISCSGDPFSCPDSFNIRVISNELTVCIRWPKYWSFSFSISLSNEYSGLITFKTEWFDLPAVQGTLKSLLQQHSLKASILQCSAFFMVQLSSPYMTTRDFHYISLIFREVDSKSKEECKKKIKANS